MQSNSLMISYLRDVRFSLLSDQQCKQLRDSAYHDALYADKLPRSGRDVRNRVVRLLISRSPASFATLSLNRALLWFVWSSSSRTFKRPSLDYACRLRRAQGIERDGSASLSVLTGKYLSRHTPPPSTTSAAASVSSTHPSRSPTLSRFPPA